MKVDRKKIHGLFDGHCIYCGCVLIDESGKYMHVEHKLAVDRDIKTGKMNKPENDVESNKYPTCPNCNIDKNSQPLESYRNSIKDRLRQLQRQSLYRSAVRYGLVEEKQWDGLFYFEKHPPQSCVE